MEQKILTLLETLISKQDRIEASINLLAKEVALEGTLRRQQEALAEKEQEVAQQLQKFLETTGGRS
jgi:hypothetical protein